MSRSLNITTVILLYLLSGGGFAAAEGDSVLLVFGDSLSASYGLTEADGWVELLLKKIHGEDYPYEVVNRSISGETTAGGLARLPAALSSVQPQLVILELGGNDGLRGLPLTHIKENLLAMVSMILNSGSGVLLTGIQIPPNYGPRYSVPFFNHYAEIATEKDIPLVPFLIEGIPQFPELMQEDGIHPGAEAQSIILDNVWVYLEPLLLRH